jgi:hypothetical protein
MRQALFQRAALLHAPTCSRSCSTGTNWFADGLHFACTDCGACCKKPVQQQVQVNERELALVADFLKDGAQAPYSEYLVPGRAFTPQIYVNKHRSVAFEHLFAVLMQHDARHQVCGAVFPVASAILLVSPICRIDSSSVQVTPAADQAGWLVHLPQERKMLHTSCQAGAMCHIPILVPSFDVRN